MGWAALALAGTGRARADEAASLDVPQVLDPALSLTLDSIHRRRHEANGALIETIERKARVRPALVLGMLGGPIVLRVVASPFADAEARLDLGFEADVY